MGDAEDRRFQERLETAQRKVESEVDNLADMGPGCDPSGLREAIEGLIDVRIELRVIEQVVR